MPNCPNTYLEKQQGQETWGSLTVPFSFRFVTFWTDDDDETFMSSTMHKLSKELELPLQMPGKKMCTS